MKAITYSAFGNASDVLKLEDLPTCLLAPGDVTVDLAFSGVNSLGRQSACRIQTGVIETRVLGDRPTQRRVRCNLCRWRRRSKIAAGSARLDMEWPVESRLGNSGHPNHTALGSGGCPLLTPSPWKPGRFWAFRA